MTILRSYGWYFILAGVALALPPWFGAGLAVAIGLTVLGALSVVGGCYLLSAERPSR